MCGDAVFHCTQLPRERRQESKTKLYFEPRFILINRVKKKNSGAMRSPIYRENSSPLSRALSSEKWTKVTALPTLDQQ
jgi:hypothetical protein